MAFRGLFIGIDRYQSPAIGEPSCACRDAPVSSAPPEELLDAAVSVITSFLS
jgi:hypothetical protein